MKQKFKIIILFFLILVCWTSVLIPFTHWIYTGITPEVLVTKFYILFLIGVVSGLLGIVVLDNILKK